MIPLAIRKQLSGDDRMRKCEICSESRVQFHHVFIYAGKQIKEAWNIAPACANCHAMATPHNSKYVQSVREQFEWNALNRMTPSDIVKYPKKDWQTLKNYLSKYGGTTA